MTNPDRALLALKEAVRLYETYGLIANNSNGNDRFACGSWINEARAAIASSERGKDSDDLPEWLPNRELLLADRLAAETDRLIGDERMTRLVVTFEERDQIVAALRAQSNPKGGR